MSGSWQKNYEELKAYIAKHPTLEIGMNVISIPGDVRPEFYRLFDTVRVNFIKDNFPASLEKAYTLSRNYGELNQALIGIMGLESIEVRAGLNWFLIDPINGLMRVLFDPLFDLLKGKIDLAGFEKVSASSVEDAFKDFFREGYERWATLGLMKLMLPDKVYNVPVVDYVTDPSLTEGDISPGLREESVSDAAEAKKISFDLPMYCSFLVPKAILHSTRLNLFVGFRPDYYESRWKARLVSQKMEWYKLADIQRDYGQSKLWPDLGIYVSDTLEDILLVSDYYQIARPDIIVEVMEEKGWYETGGLELVKRHYEILKPRLGSFVISREPVPEAVLKELEPKPVPVTQPAEVAASETPAPQPADAPVAAPEPMPATPPPDIHILSVGYEVAKLEPVIDSIVKAQAKSEEAKPEAGST